MGILGYSDEFIVYKRQVVASRVLLGTTKLKAMYIRCGLRVMGTLSELRQ